MCLLASLFPAIITMDRSNPVVCFVLRCSYGLTGEPPVGLSQDGADRICA